MKKVLVLTDLGDASAHAAQSAIALCAKLHTNISLLHCSVAQPALADYPNNRWEVDNFIYGERCKGKLEQLTGDLEEQIEILSGGVYHPFVDWEQADGSVADCASARLKKGDIELIVMGAPAGSKLDHLLLGSDTNMVMNRVRRPVLVVPVGHHLQPLKKVTFASDFNAEDIVAVHYLTRLGRKFNFQLEIVHVTIFGHDDAEALERKAAFQQHVAKFNYPAISYENIYGKNIVLRLHKLCKENGSDVLALSHDHHSFWGHLFRGTHSGELLKSQELPVLVIPASMETSGF